jgi:hypothetical protein
VNKFASVHAPHFTSSVKKENKDSPEKRKAAICIAAPFYSFLLEKQLQPELQRPRAVGGVRVKESAAGEVVVDAAAGT